MNKVPERTVMKRMANGHELTHRQEHHNPYACTHKGICLLRTFTDIKYPLSGMNEKLLQMQFLFFGKANSCKF